MKTLHFLLPGDPNTRTGGYIYDARITDGLRSLGWKVEVHRLHDSFPEPNAAALVHAAQQLETIDDHALVLVDGLAFAAMPQLAQKSRERLTLIALVHHPLAAETGLSAQQIEAFRISEASALDAAQHVIVTSARTAADLHEHYKVPARKLSVVTPGTDPVPAPLHQNAPREGDPITRLLCVGTVTPRKGHDLLIAALAPLAGRRWQLRCAGSIERSTRTVKELRGAIRQAGMHEQVQLLGELEEAALHDCYRWADVFVLATRFEGYGMALAEAMAHGLPIITSAGGTAASTVGTQAALLFPPEDVNALSQALQRMISEPQLRAHLAAAAQQRAQELPSWQNAALAMQKILRTVHA